MVNKEEFVDWKSNPVTQAVFSSIAERINEVARDLASSAGLDQSKDRFKCGMVHAFQELLTIELDELEGVEKDA